MHARGAYMMKNPNAVRVIKIRRGGACTSGNGPTGWKLRPSKVLARSLAAHKLNWRTKKAK